MELTVGSVAGAAGLRNLMRQGINPKTMTPIGDRTSVVPFPLELMMATNGFGPYPLITVTERGCSSAPSLGAGISSSAPSVGTRYCVPPPFDQGGTTPFMRA